MQVVNTTYEQSVCISSHMTLFGAGFFVQPNSMDFDYVMKLADFEDNMTMYMTVIVTLILLLISLIVARWLDVRDRKELHQ